MSINNLYTMIVSGKLEAPPGTALVKRGHALTSVFSGAKYFKNTGEKVQSINPLSRKRRVWLWRYYPDQDDRGASRTRSQAFMEESVW